MANTRLKGKLDIKENNDQIEEKKPGIFQKLFFLIIIPLLFILAILLALATFTNVNVFEKAEELLPFGKDDATVESGKINSEDEIVKLKAQLKEKEAEIEQLNSKIETLTEEKQNSEAKQEQLKYQMEKLQQEQTDKKKDQAEIIRSFEKMSAKKAAPIIAAMNEKDALEILSSLKADTLSKVLENMGPSQAAKFTEKLSKE